MFYSFSGFQLLLKYSVLARYNLINAGIFDVLAYTDKEAEVPLTWIDSDPKLIDNPQMVKLHSFDTKVVVIVILHTC